MQYDTNVYHLQNIGDKDAMIQMFTTSRIQETKMQYDTNVYHLQNIGDKMQYDTNVYHLQNIGDKDAIRYKCLPPLEYRRQRCNMIQMFTTSRIQETKMRLQMFTTSTICLQMFTTQNIGDKDAI